MLDHLRAVALPAVVPVALTDVVCFSMISGTLMLPCAATLLRICAVGSHNRPSPNGNVYTHRHNTFDVYIFICTACCVCMLFESYTRYDVHVKTDYTSTVSSCQVYCCTTAAY